MFPRDIVCLRNMSISTLHKGDDDDDDDMMMVMMIIIIMLLRAAISRVWLLQGIIIIISNWDYFKDI